MNQIMFYVWVMVRFSYLVFFYIVIESRAINIPIATLFINMRTYILSSKFCMRNIYDSFIIYPIGKIMLFLTIFWYMCMIAKIVLSYFSIFGLASIKCHNITLVYLNYIFRTTLKFTYIFIF